MKLLELLQAGDVEGFNLARESADGRIEFFAEELDGLKLHLVDLSGVSLDKSDLTGTDLSEATLVRASLADIDGTHANLDGVFAMKVRLRDAWMEGASLKKGDFTRGDLAGVVLTSSTADGARFLGARLKEAQLDKAHWHAVDLTEAHLKAADITGTDLTGSVLTGAKLTQLKGEGAILDRVQGEQVNMGGASLVGASLKGANLPGINLAGANLSGADLSGAVLSKANLVEVDLTNANLTGAVLTDAALDGATLEGAVFDDADLTGVDVDMLGVGASVKSQLAGHGARFDPDAELVFDDAAVAMHDTQVGVCWVNPDAADTPTVRWAIGEGETFEHGVLPVSGASVLAHAILPDDDGFVVVLLLDRPGGETLARWKLSMDGELTDVASAPLGYEPAVLPVFSRTDDGVVVWGLARRGPTIVMHRDDGGEEGFQPVWSERHPQARGFLGHIRPVLACKAGILMQVTERGMGGPLTTPDGFPARTCAAVPVGDDVLTVWNQTKAPRDPGGIRYRWLGPRRPREDEVLTTNPAVNAIDGLQVGDEALVAWTEDDGGLGGRVHTARLPSGEVDKIAFEHLMVDGIRLVVPRDRSKDPVMAVTTLAGSLFVSDLQGRILARFSDHDRT